MASYSMIGELYNAAAIIVAAFIIVAVCAIVDRVLDFLDSNNNDDS